MSSKNRTALLRVCRFLTVGLLLAWPPSAWAQAVVATVPVGTNPSAIAVNPVTSKIYVANCIPPSGGIGGRGTPGAVTIIDGATNTTTTVPAGICPTAVAVNPTTNKIYVANFGFSSITCGSCTNFGSITVIDGATNAGVTITDPNAKSPEAVAVNSATNEIYVANNFSDNVTVLDGATNMTTTITDPNAAFPFAVAVNSTTNKIYIANQGSLLHNGANPGNVTVIDGNTNATTTVTDPNAISPDNVAVNSTTNKIYVANEGDYPGSNHGNVTVIDGTTNSVTTLTDSNALAPVGVAVNQTTNKIYVADANDSAVTGNGGVTVIDGATNSLSFVSTGPNSHIVHAVALDSMTNTIYVASEGCFQGDPCRNPGSVTVFNGVTNAVSTVINSSAHNPEGVAVNEMHNKIYVANTGSSNVSVVDGGAIPTSHTLSVVLEGNGSGTVTSSPTGINCGTSCTASFTPGTAVSLTASAASGSQFSGWSTNCTGTGSCNVTLTTSDEFVMATFNTASLPADFSITPATPSLTLQRGAQVTDVISIAPLSGSFSNVVQLSCAVTGSMPLATCSLSPVSVTPGANPANSTVTVTAPSQSAELTPFNNVQSVGSLCAAFLPIPLALVGFGLSSAKSRQRRHQLWFLYSFFIAVMALLAGCGGGSSNPPPPTPLNYTVAVTATSGAIQHMTQINVNVP